MIVKMFDLKVRKGSLRRELIKSINTLFDHGQFFLGPEVLRFEKKISKFLGVKYAVGVSSGSSALYLALKACGIKPGDEVITSPLSWIITSNAIMECGARPIFVDVGDDLNINPDLIEKAITKKTKAIVPMHYGGHMCDMSKILKIAKMYNLKIVEDAAQSFGASLNKKKSGNYSLAASFSMNPMKTLSGYGENGVVITNNKKIYLRLKRLRHAGTTSDPKKKITNYCVESSLNHKMDTINASLLLVSFKNFSKVLKKKNDIANYYSKNLSSKVIKQEDYLHKHEKHGRYVYPIMVNKRDKMRNYLKKNGIETKIFHLPLINKSPFYRKYSKKFSIPNAEKLIKKIIILSLNEKLLEKQVIFTTNKINKFIKNEKL
jgi:dTDP-4-amino-4,6-dideoxygalactose transaminase